MFAYTFLCTKNRLNWDYRVFCCQWDEHLLLAYVIVVNFKVHMFDEDQERKEEGWVVKEMKQNTVWHTHIHNLCAQWFQLNLLEMCYFSLFASMKRASTKFDTIDGNFSNPISAFHTGHCVFVRACASVSVYLISHFTLPLHIPTRKKKYFRRALLLLAQMLYMSSQRMWTF